MVVRSILLVDDDPDIRQLTRQNLESAGYEVRCAIDGLEAARLANRESFDLLLTDLVMPDRDGLELIREMHQTHPGLRIIAMSGGGRGSADLYLRMARGFRVDGILPKPFSSRQLLAVVRSVEARAGSPSAPCVA